MHSVIAFHTFPRNPRRRPETEAEYFALAARTSRREERRSRRRALVARLRHAR
jgi:hypothetical protein